MFRFAPRLLYLMLLFALFGGVSALAQTARVSGQVTDTDGGAIPGASVQVVNQATTAKRTVKTDASGSYSVSFLAEGNYQVIIEAPSFSTTASQVISLATGQAYAFDAKLTVGPVSSTVEVNGDVNNGVELYSASMSTTLSDKEVSGYGLNGRNFSALITMAPGVSNQTGQDEAKVGVAGSAKFSVNGGRVEYNTFEVDGSDVLNTSINASRGQGEPLEIYPSIDAISEMKVLTTNYSAMYGKSASGSVLVTTKSGTDKFHGNAYEFIRNEMFNARNYFDQPDPVPVGYTGKLKYRTPLYRRQDFGVTIGGPLFIPHVYNTSKQKTFFFFSEEVRREKTPVDYNQAVPTMAERGQGAANPGVGDFTDVCPTPAPGTHDYLTVSANPDCPQGTRLNGNIQPQRLITLNYTSQALLNSGLIPEPNAVSGCNTTNPSPVYRCYVAAVSPPTHWREELFRIDHNVTPNEILSFRYVHDSWDTVTLAPQWGVVQNSFPTVENFLNGPGLNLEMSLTQSLPHAFLNRISGSYAVEHISLKPQSGPGLNYFSRPAILDNASPSVTMSEPGAVSTAAISGAPLCSAVTGPAQTNPGSNGTAQTLAECPMGHIFNNGFGGDKLPGLDFQGTNGAYGGHGFAADTGYAPWNQANPTFSVRDDASKTVGSHTLQFGAQGTYIQQNELSAVTGANSGDLQGLLTFSNQQSKYDSGNTFADFLAGPGLEPLGSSGALATGGTQTGIKSFTQDSGQGKYYNRYKMVEMYLQDDWRATKNLTLNLGFRASFFGAWYNPKSTAYNWRPEAYNQSLGGSIMVNSNYGYLVRMGTQIPVSLNPSGGPYSLNPTSPSGLDPIITNGLVQCGTNGLSSTCLKNQRFHPAPRVGFSWDPNGRGKTAIRGGYGLFWEHGTGYEANVGSLIGGAPLVLSETQSNIPSISATSSAYNAIGFSCQEGSTQCGSLTIPTGNATFPLNVTSIPTKAVYSYTQQWSLSFQQEVRKNMVAQLAYVGTKGTHLTAVRDLNQLPYLAGGLNPFLPGQPITANVCSSGANDPNHYFSTAGTNSTTGPVTVPTSPGIGPLSPGYKNIVVACTGNPGFAAPQSSPLGISADDVRPYPGFSNIISVENIADSEYHALQGTLRETAGPLTIGVAYTYSHSLDDASDRSSANFANSLDIHSNHASSDFDQRHLLNVSYIYDLPLLHMLGGFAHLVGSGSDPDDAADAAKPAAASNHDAPLMKTLFDGWQLSGITTYQTGTPFSVVNGGGSNGTGPADNAGVGDGLGIGSYADRMPGITAKSGKPYVAPNANNVGPLLLNPGGYTAPSGLTFGNSGRNSLNNPSRINFNASLFKHFKPFGEGRDVEFRAEAFNVFNHTQFRITDPSHPGNTGNNVINCYGPQSAYYSAGYPGDNNGNASCLVGNSFLHPVDAHDPRILQFGLKLAF